ncbi:MULTISPECIES: PadR family transcriptional regulator [unclassified Cryobacterium]|uniref:PadR family transcriptional regulator n=1 Tax=unclassified Cryobacterium TaxID=2649013 RepID=UPI000CE33038|nr:MULTISPECIES: PadR family transcriptional regulator [unclassified Cryobacterium]
MTQPPSVPAVQQDAQSLRGVLPMLILSQLHRAESYGYELVVRLQDIGLSDLATGTVYPVLSRLEQDGSLTSRLVASTAGPARKYYTLSPAGKEALKLSTARWRYLVAIVHMGLGPIPTDEPDQPESLREEPK